MAFYGRGNCATLYLMVWTDPDPRHLIELSEALRTFLNIQFIFYNYYFFNKNKKSTKKKTKNVALKTKQHITRRGRGGGVKGARARGLYCMSIVVLAVALSPSLSISLSLAALNLTLESTGQILRCGLTRWTIDLAIVVAAIGIETIKAANDRGNGGVVVLLELVGASQLVVLSLDLLLGLVRLLVGLVLDEEHLWLAGLCGRRCGNVSGIQIVILLAQHVDDSLLLLWCKLGGVFHIGIVASRRLDEDHAIVLLRSAQHQMLCLAIVAVILWGRNQVELLVDDRCLCGACRRQILLAATMWYCQLTGIRQSQAADATHVAQQITDLWLLVAVLGTCLGQGEQSHGRAGK